MGWELLSRATGRESTPGFMMDVLRSARADGALWLLVIAFCVAAPVTEEFFARGFLYRGWSESFLRYRGAISCRRWSGRRCICNTTGIFFGEVFSIGLLLGYLRYRYQSTWLTIIVHGLNNLAASCRPSCSSGRAKAAICQRTSRAFASRSSAPCRMKIAACSSITSARRARLMSMPINSRSTAAVESRSSHSAMASSVSSGKIARKGAGRLRARSLAAVHVDGQAEHEPDGGALAGDGEQARGVGLERLALDGLDPGRKPAVGIGYRNPDGLGAEIEADQRAAFGPVRGGIDQR